MYIKKSSFCKIDFSLSFPGPQLEKLMEQLRTEMESNPPLPGAYSPKKGDLCAAKFSQDGQW